MSTRPTWHRECAGAREAVWRCLEGLAPQDGGDLDVAPFTTASGWDAAGR
jgi:hypothetical protein